jgi:hypothetical protein
MFFVNCPLDRMKERAKTCFLDNQPVWFGCDVAQESLYDEGLMMPSMFDYGSMYGMDFPLSRKELFETYSTSPTHNMVFTGIDIADSRVVFPGWGKCTPNPREFRHARPIAALDLPFGYLTSGIQSAGCVVWLSQRHGP